MEFRDELLLSSVGKVVRRTLGDEEEAKLENKQDSKIYEGMNESMHNCHGRGPPICRGKGRSPPGAY